MRKYLLRLKFFSFLFLNGISTSVLAQQEQFQKKLDIVGSKSSYCLEEIKGVCDKTAYSGYILLTDSFALIKTDLTGNIIWKKHYNYPYGGFSTYMQETADCGFLIAGSVFDSAHHKQFNLIKTDMNGDLQWSRQFLPPINNSIIDTGSAYGSFMCGIKARQTIDGGYVILGQVNSDTSNSMRFQIIKTDSLGNLQWSKLYNEDLYSVLYKHGNVYDMDLTHAGLTEGFILLGHAVGPGINDTYISLIRLDNNGSILWSKKYPCVLVGMAIKETEDKGFIITGGVTVFALKTDSMGNVEWFKDYDFNFCVPPYDFEIAGYSVKQTYNKGYLIGCGNMTSLTLYEALLIKIDTIGNLEWCTDYFGSSIASSVIQCRDSGYAFSGGLGSQSFFTKTYFVKTDSSGLSGCNERTVTPCVFSPSIQEISIGDTLTILPGSAAIIPTTQIPTVTELIYCSLTHTGDAGSDLTFYISPNPAHQSVDIGSEFTLKSIEIFNLLGEKMYAAAVSSKQSTINIENFSAGIYFVKLQSEKGSAVQKLVVQ